MATAIDFLKAVREGKIVFSSCDTSKAKGYVQEKVTVQPKYSASPSDTAFSTLALSALGGSTLPISLKIFKDEVEDKQDPDISGLKYEMKIYQRIIDNIILQNQSPNFVGYVGSACCSTVDGFYSNLARYLGYKNYCILATEKVGNGAYFGYNQMLPVKNLYMMYFDLNRKEKKQILLQVCYALELLQRYRIVHNDLHAGNVLVMTLPEPVTLGFNIGEKKYKVETKYIPYLFDWDLAYCEVFGNNPKIDTEDQKSLNIYNKFDKKLDLYVLLCGLREFNGMPDINIHIEYDQEYKIEITEELAKKIQKFSHMFTDDYSDEYYRLGRKQIEEFFGEKYPQFKKLTYMTVSAYKDYDHLYYVKFIRPFRCRPATISTEMYTPLSYIEENLCIFSTDNLDDVPVKYTYTLPSEQKIQTILIDPFASSAGRGYLEKMGIKPRFPPQKSGKVKVKSYVDLVSKATGRSKPFYKDWSKEELSQRLEAAEEENRNELVKLVSSLTKRPKKFYEKWTNSQLKERLEAFAKEDKRKVLLKTISQVSKEPASKFKKMTEDQLELYLEDLERSDKKYLIKIVSRITGRSKQFYRKWSKEELEQRFEASREELIRTISKLSNRPRSFYENWTTNQLKERLEAFDEMEEERDKMKKYLEENPDKNPKYLTPKKRDPAPYSDSESDYTDYSGIR